jgi:predicted ATPase/DNA-binding SARP family transcriptional activator
MLSHPWRFELFGGLRAHRNGREITRFRTRKTASLLACLVYFPARTPSRDELAELFWPDAAPNAGRINLRTALASLRRQLEGPDSPVGTVLLADNNNIRLNPCAFTSDVADFARLLQQRVVPVNRDAAVSCCVPALAEAVALYRGELLPGFYEEWIVPERLRTAEACYEALHRLVRAVEQSGDLTRALDYALRAVGLDPWRQEGHEDAIRLYAATDQTVAARRQLRVLEKLLREELHCEPSPSVRALIESLRNPSARPLSDPQKAPERLLPPQTGATLPVPSPPSPPPLPVAMTRFFGREEEIASLQAFVNRETNPPGDGATTGARLITLTGPGGSGKTRLALEVARRSAARFDDLVYFAALAEIDDAALIPDKLLSALGLLRKAETDPLLQVIDALRRRPALVILDNFEQLVDAGSQTIEMLCGLPGLICLVTSRQRLGMEGEQEFPVLPLPTPTHVSSTAAVSAFPSVQLFTDRAQLVRPDFQITARNAAAIGRLCDRLEGLPLALELAASWAAVLSPTQMLEQMEDRFAFLVSRNRGRPPRHKTLHAAIDSSVRLLNPETRPLFARLAIFRGGWTSEAAQHVCVVPETLPHLALLQEHSLVQANEHEAVMRFSMLESLRQFAWAQVTPVERGDLAARHARYFLRLAEEAESALATAEQTQWLDLLDTEHDNMRAALVWAQSESGDTETLFALVCTLSRFWFLRGYFQEGRKRLEEALNCDASRVPARLRARALLESAMLAHYHGDNRVAYAYARQSLSLYESLGDERGVAQAYNRLGNVATIQGDHEAAAGYQQAVLQFWRRLGVTREIASALNNIGNNANARGDYAAARSSFEEGLVLARMSADASVTAILVGNLGLTTLFQGDPAAAQRHFEESLALRRQLGSQQGIAGSKANLAMAAFEMGRLEEAIRLNAEALILQNDGGDTHSLAYSFEACMLFSVSQGDYRRAALLGGAAEAIREKTRSPLNVAYFRSHSERSRDAICLHLKAARMRDAWNEGRALSIEQSVSLALKEP